MEIPDFDTALDSLLAADSRYAREAYHFVREVLEASQTSRRARGHRASEQVGARELLARIRVDAIDQFGPMTCAVFEAWGVRSCEDFGEIVFNMMSERIILRGRRDRREDFQAGFDFSEAFRAPFVPCREAALVDG
ncbi:MAG: hypothetical protein JNL10_17680 [Verrucomicrobiales bacterium]|nr:hypothetical protein [Verrucomicrobiales bacterium]